MSYQGDEKQRGLKHLKKFESEWVNMIMVKSRKRGRGNILVYFIEEVIIFFCIQDNPPLPPDRTSPFIGRGDMPKPPRM